MPIKDRNEKISREGSNSSQKADVPFGQTAVAKAIDTALSPIEAAHDLLARGMNAAAEGIHQATRNVPFIGDGPYNRSQRESNQEKMYEPWNDKKEQDPHGKL